MFHNCSLYSDAVIPFTVWDAYNIYSTWLTHLGTINTLCWFTTDSPHRHKLPTYDHFLSRVSLFVVPHRNLHWSRCLGTHHGFVWDWTCFCIFHRYTSSTFLQCFTNIFWTPPLSQFVVASRGVSPGFRWVALLASLVVLTLLTHFPVCATPAPPPQVMSKQC